MIYHIVGNFRRKNILRTGKKYDFLGENFCGLLTLAAPKHATLPNFT